LIGTILLPTATCTRQLAGSKSISRFRDNDGSR
jgi:hypothetical protein